MAALRKIWIHENINDKSSKVLFTRSFQTQERRAKRNQGINYVPTPDNDEFSQVMLTALGIRKKYPEFLRWRDRIDKKTQLPVVDIKTKNGNLWPIVVIEHNGCLLCCLPTIDEVFKNDGGEFADLFHNPSVTMGVMLLEALSTIIGNYLISAKLKDIETFLNISMPFGRPSDLDPSNVFSLLTLTSEQVYQDSQPKSLTTSSYKSGKGKSSLGFAIQEFVRCVMWDRARVSALAQIYGSVLVQAELESSLTDVSVSISYDAKDKPILVEGLLYHPCIHSSSLSNMEQILSDLTPKKIKFTPQSKKLKLCNYEATLKTIPIIGEYHMKGQDTVELDLKLTLVESLLKRKFTYFEARFPFFNRGRIRKVECKPSWGLVHLTDDKQTLVWNIGQNFQGKGTQLSLKATVNFGSSNPGFSNHPFCHGNNAYVQLEFLVPNYTLSGCYIDLKTIQISPPYKTKLETGRELRASDYKIWNSNGDIPFYAPDVMVEGSE